MANYFGDPRVDIAAEEAWEPELQQLVDPMNSGFVWYLPPMATATYKHEGIAGHEWSIAGHDMQILMITVAPEETIVTEVGSFMMGSSGIDMDVELTCRTKEGCQRICGGESCVKLLLSNQSPVPGYVGLTPNFPAKIMPLEFGKHMESNHALIAQAGTYMSHLGNVDVACDLDCSCATCCCAGFGCCRQKITGADNSIAFLAAGGTLIYRNLEPGEQVTVNSQSVVAMEETVKLGIVSNGRFGMCCCGGEGCYSTTLTGPGKIFMQVRHHCSHKKNVLTLCVVAFHQSMNFQKFKDAVQVTLMDDRGE